jgi:hypothetical protein
MVTITIPFRINVIPPYEKQTIPGYLNLCQDKKNKGKNPFGGILARGSMLPESLKKTPFFLLLDRN